MVTTFCSGCMNDVRVTSERVTVHVPHNGARGVRRVPAHTLSGDVFPDDILWQWDCPSCGYADSLDLIESGNERLVRE